MVNLVSHSACQRFLDVVRDRERYRRWQVSKGYSPPAVVDYTFPVDDLSSESAAATGDDYRDAELARLEALPADKRALEIPGVAKALGTNVSALREALKVRQAMKTAATVTSSGIGAIIETLSPWEHEVSLTDVLDRIAAEIRRYVVLEEHYVTLATLWAAHTFAIDSLDISPYLIITAGSKGCGKSTAQDILRQLSYRSYAGVMPTAALVFRIIDTNRPSLFIDEVDNLFKNPEAAAGLTGVLNAGYVRNDANVPRLTKVGDDWEPRGFSCFGPKCLSGIGRCVPDTITSRSLKIVMRRALRTERRESIRRRNPIRDARHLEIRRQALRWAIDNAETIASHEPRRHDFLANRAEEIWEPLLTIAELAGDEWAARAIEVAKQIESEAAEAPSLTEELVADVSAAFANAPSGQGFLSSEDLIRSMASQPDSRWASYDLRSGREITPRQLAKLMGDVFNTSPKPTRHGGRIVRGYCWGEIRETAERFGSPSIPLESATSATSVTAPTNPGYFPSNYDNVADVAAVADFQAMSKVVAKTCATKPAPSRLIWNSAELTTEVGDRQGAERDEMISVALNANLTSLVHPATALKALDVAVWLRSNEAGDATVTYRHERKWIEASPALSSFVQQHADAIVQSLQ